ncbi:MAG: DUF2268 domain-containing putative Zn-dependent protease [Patescibacteria group bacterium]
MDFSAQGKVLLALCVNLQGDTQPKLPTKVADIWKAIAPQIKDDRQTLYVRDISEATIEGRYPGGYSPNAHEAFVAVEEWPTDEPPLIDAIAHELHHLTRWQNGGYGQTLGRALVTEGMACWFAGIQSGWQAPWITGPALAPKVWRQIEQQWDNEQYNHAEWFFDGPFGKWAGYRAGYWLVKQALNDTFDLEQSVQLKDDAAKRFIPRS